MKWPSASKDDQSEITGVKPSANGDSPDGTGHNHVDGPYFSNFAAAGLEPHVDSRLGKRWCRSIFGPISSGGLDNRPVRRTTRFGCQFIGLGGSNAFVGLGYYPVDLLYSFRCCTSGLSYFGPDRR